ncbi:MAG: hypothetical protein OER88_07690 [Planctomycetota bacterium]|nr:hypothetical protein [Planctomycetota bacterium]
MEISVGSLVVPSPRFRAAMETGEGAAILIARQRGNVHLYYPGRDNAYWVPTRDVRPIPSEAVPEVCLERFLSNLILRFECDECSIESAPADGLRLTLEIPALSRTDLEDVRRSLGDILVDYAFEAGSMRAMVCKLTLGGLPPSADEGR